MKTIMKNVFEFQELKSIGFKTKQLLSTGGLEYNCMINSEYGIVVKYNQQNDTYILYKSGVSMIFVNEKTFYSECSPLIFNDFVLELLPIVKFLINTIEFHGNEIMEDLEKYGVLNFH
jgi:hypothetical protein